MNFTHVNEMFLHQVFLHCNRPNGSKYANTQNKRLDRAFMAKQSVYC